MAGMKIIGLIDAEVKRVRCATEAAELELKMAIEDEISALRQLVEKLERDAERLEPHLQLHQKPH